MTFPDAEFVSILTLAKMYDTNKDEIRMLVRKLQQSGHIIHTLEWGAQRKLKVNPVHFRKAIMAEYKEQNNLD